MCAGEEDVDLFAGGVARRVQRHVGWGKVSGNQFTEVADLVNELPKN